MLLHGKRIGSCLPYGECSITCCLYNHDSPTFVWGLLKGSDCVLFTPVSLLLLSTQPDPCWVPSCPTSSIIPSPLVLPQGGP